MKSKLTLVVLALVMGACAKMESNKARANFFVLEKAKSMGVLMRAEHWCINGSKPVSAYSFQDGNNGEFVVMNADNKSAATKDILTWDLQDDALTIGLPPKYEPNILTKKVRFQGATGQEQLVLMEEDGSYIVLSSCTLS